MNIQQARATFIRRLVADTFHRSFKGTHEGTHFRRDLDINRDQQEEIAWRIDQHFGVKVAVAAWTGFSTLGQLIEYVETELQKEHAPNG